MTAQPMTAEGAMAQRPSSLESALRDHGWTIGLLVLLAALAVFTKVINPFYDSFAIQSLATSIVPLGLAAVAQAVCVIAGGIDLSIGSQMALTSCIAAVLMQGQSDPVAIAIIFFVLFIGLLLGALNGVLVVLTRVPDIIVTLATSFVFAGMALLVTPRPTQSVQIQWLKDLAAGPLFIELLPKAFVVMLVLVGIIWIPLKRSKLGLSLYAVGSNRLAAFRSGVSVNRTKFWSYVIAGLFAALGGLALTASTGIGTPVPDASYILIAIAAVVLGGVSLAGGTGGVIGPILAVIVLQLIRNDMTFLRLDPNYALVAQGLILIGVLMVGSFLQMRRAHS
jgi:ribose transport system permease protein